MGFKNQGRHEELRTSREIFIDWLANQNPLWKAYLDFMSGRLIALDKQPGFLPVGIRESWLVVVVALWQFYSGSLPCVGIDELQKGSPGTRMGPQS